MASWFGGLSSSVGCYLEQMSHSVVSLTRHISRCTKAVWITEYETEESNELRRKEVETTKETVRPEDERFVTFYSDLDLEYKQQTTAYNDLLIKGDLDKNVFIGKEIRITQKLQNLQKDTQCVNAATGFVPATSSTSLGENIDPKASEYKHELRQKNLKVKILRERHEAMKRKLLKLQNANQSINVAPGLIPATSPSTSLCNIDHSASEYEYQFKQQNLEMKILRGRNVAMRRKLLKLQKAIECLNAAAGLLPATSSASLGENIDSNSSEYKHELEQKNLEVKILRGRNIAMKQKLFKVQKASECLNAAAGLIPAMPASTSLAENIDRNASEYKNQLEQQNFEMKILRGRNVAMKYKLLKLQKATQCLNAAAGLLPATSSTSLGEIIDPKASECKHQLKQKNLEVKILRVRHGAMKHKLLKLKNATESINAAAGLLPATPALTSLGDNIDHKSSEYEHQLEQQNLKMKILRGRNAAMKHKLLKLQKAIECLNVAAGLLPATSSASLGEIIDSNASEYKHELEQKILEVKILRGRNVAMKHKLHNLQKTTQCLNAAAGLIPAMPASTSLGDNIDHNASEYKKQFEQENLEMKILAGRNVAMKHKLLKLLKATECLNEAAGLVPATSSSLGEIINPNASEYKHQLKQKNLEMKILRERHAAMKRRLLHLQKATESINAAAGLLTASSTSLGENIDPKASECKYHLKQENLEMKILREKHEAVKHKFLKLENATESVHLAAGLVPAMPASTSLGNNSNQNASEYKHELEQKNLEVKILRERHGAMKRKLLKLQNATQSVNAAGGLVPATPILTSLGDNSDQNASEYKHQLKQQNLEMKILRGRNATMKHKLLKLQKATECLNAAAGLLPATSSASLGENIDSNASEYKHELEQKILEVKILRGRNVAIKHKWLNLQKGTQCLNVVAGLVSAAPASTSLNDNIHHNACEYKNQLEQQNLEMKILRGRNVAMKYKLLKLLKATQCLNAAAGLISATSSASLGENIGPQASECKHELEQKNLELKILRGRNVAMKRRLLKLENATESVNAAAGLLPATSPSTSLCNIDHSASEYEYQFKQQNLKMKILRGRNVAMKHKLFKLQKAIECLNAAAGLLPATSSASLGENIDPNASKYKHELEQKNLEVKILRGRNVAMKHKLLNLQKGTQCLNEAAGLIPAMPALTSLGDNIDHNASEYEHQLKQQNLEMKILRGRNVAMKYKLLKLLKATQCLNAAAGLIPATSSASLGENINPDVSEYKHQLEQKNLEMKILRERHAAMKCNLLKLQKAIGSVHMAAGLVPAMPASMSLDGNIDHNASENHHQLELKNITYHASSIFQHLPEQNDLVDLVKSISNVF